MQSDCSKLNLKQYFAKLGFDKIDENLVTTALCHSSYTQENNLSYLKCYERLEFLGDAVLKLIVSDYLFNRFPEYKEGDLSKIRSIAVSDDVMAEIAGNINLDEHILLGASAEKDDVRSKSSVHACAMEAVIGAMHISGHDKEIKEFIIKELEPIITQIDEKKSIYNSKALLQEYTQKKSNELPEYKIIKESGQAHQKTFEIEVLYNGNSLGKGKAQSKKRAQQEAAHNACIKLGLIK